MSCQDADKTKGIINTREKMRTPMGKVLGSYGGTPRAFSQSLRKLKEKFDGIEDIPIPTDTDLIASATKLVKKMKDINVPEDHVQPAYEELWGRYDIGGYSTEYNQLIQKARLAAGKGSMVRPDGAVREDGNCGAKAKANSRIFVLTELKAPVAAGSTTTQLHGYYSLSATLLEGSHQDQPLPCLLLQLDGDCKVSVWGAGVSPNGCHIFEEFYRLDCHLGEEYLLKRLLQVFDLLAAMESLDLLKDDASLADVRLSETESFAFKPRSQRPAWFTAKKAAATERIYVGTYTNATATSKNNDAVLKSLSHHPSYGTEVHKQAHVLGIAAEYYGEAAFGPHRHVCMEALQSAELNYGDFYESFKKFAATLERLDGVHGDIRDDNIVDTTDGVKLIDFDWAGRAEEVAYPLLVNTENVTWATPGGLIKKEHDHAACGAILEAYARAVGEALEHSERGSDTASDL